MQEQSSEKCKKETRIKNVACFDQVAIFLNLEKTFSSFFKSDFNKVVKKKVYTSTINAELHLFLNGTKHVK